jgi:hypothetical protein
MTPNTTLTEGTETNIFQALVATWCLRLWHDAVVNEDTSILGGGKSAHACLSSSSKCTNNYPVGKKLGIGKWGLSDYVNKKYNK